MNEKATEILIVPPAASADRAPDWGAVSDEVLCPLCEYNLRGIAQPRCPECGYRFKWEEMLDERRRRHPYLFEHHPERNVGSFLRTAHGGLRPRRFWSSLHPVQPSRVSRLLAYHLIASMAAIVLSVSALALETGLAQGGFSSGFRANMSVTINNTSGALKQYAESRYGSVQGYVNAVYPRSTRATILQGTWRTIQKSWPIGSGPGAMLLVRYAPVVLWPWATVLSLLIFQMSMRRIKVRPIHLLRAAIYTHDVVICVTLAMFLFAMGKLALNFPDSILLVVFEWLPIGCAFLLVLLCYRLHAATMLYLRFDRAWAVVVASQVIVVLILLNLILPLEIW